MKKTTVSVAGCSLADILYADIDFTAPAFTACASKKDGDGGLAPGKLVFADALEAFTGKSYPELKRALTGGAAPHAENLGGRRLSVRSMRPRYFPICPSLSSFTERREMTELRIFSVPLLQRLLWTPPIM